MLDMPLYKVTANRWRRVKHKEGRMVSSERFFRGDVVELSEDEAATLVKQGGLAPHVEDSENTEEQSPAPAAPAPAEVTETPTEEDGDADAASEGEDEEEMDYSEFSYAELQQEAKGRGLSGAGSSADLVERLQADDASKQ